MVRDVSLFLIGLIVGLWLSLVQVDEKNARLQIQGELIYEAMGIIEKCNQQLRLWHELEDERQRHVKRGLR